MKYLHWLPVVFLFLISCSDQDSEKIIIDECDIIGSWEMKSVYWIGKDTTYSLEKALPGVFIFEKNRYSIQWSANDDPRVPFADLSKPTEKEIIAGFRSVVFNAGTFECSDSTVTTKAIIAKVPGFEGGLQFYNYTISGDVLELIMFDEIYPDGTKPRWSGNYKTKFVMNRAK